MNVNYTQLDNVNGELTVTVEANDYADKVKKQIKEIGKNRPEPGFRPGHTPEGLLRKKYGTAVKYDVINKEVGDAVFNYIRENNLKVLGNPVPSKDEDFDINNDNFTFKFKVGVAPEINTHVDKDLHIPYYTIKVSDEMIDTQSDALRKRMGRQVSGEAVEENALVKGVLVELNEDGSIKEGGILVENGIVAPSYFKNKDQEKLFEAKKVGEEVIFNPAATCDGNAAELSSMLNIDKSDADNHKGDFKMNIGEIIVVEPAALDQEYYDSIFGKDKVHNEEEYRAALKDMLAAQLANDSFYRFTLDAKDAILKAVGDIELPEAVLKEYLIQSGDNITEENVDEVFASMRAQLIWQLVRDEIAAKLDIKVEEEDMLNMARAMARQQFAQYGMTNVPDDMLDKYAHNILDDKKFREQLFGQTLEQKLFRGIKANVTEDPKEVTVEEFNALFAPAE
ncbi:MAG: trigger factor [Muribaculaceae bacterium]|nr:trigger factor [Muribaculaceae bacterium]